MCFPLSEGNVHLLGGAVDWRLHIMSDMKLQQILAQTLQTERLKVNEADQGRKSTGISAVGGPTPFQKPRPSP